MADLQAAAAMLRDSNSSLPEELQHPWRPVSSRRTVVGVPANPDGSGAYSQAADCDNDEPDDRDVAAHIALTASPDRVAHAAALLEAIDGYDGDFAGIRLIAESLADAIAPGVPAPSTPDGDA